MLWTLFFSNLILQRNQCGQRTSFRRISGRGRSRKRRIKAAPPQPLPPAVILLASLLNLKCRGSGAAAAGLIGPTKSAC
jgi:hypothetical protein